MIGQDGLKCRHHHQELRVARVNQAPIESSKSLKRNMLHKRNQDTDFHYPIRRTIIPLFSSVIRLIILYFIDIN
jgi:hypothetical protein